MKTRLFLLFMLPSQLLFATEQTSTVHPVATSPLSTINLMQTLLGLLTVIVCIVLLAWLLKRSQHFHTTANGQLKIIAGIPLGARERAVLIQVGNEQILLGVTPQQINTLYKLDTPLELPPSSKVPSEFANKLRQLMQQRGQS